jgi:hypothetical protein
MGGERHTIASLDVLRGFAISSVVVGQFATPQIELSLAVGLSIAGVVTVGLYRKSSPFLA